MLENVGRASIIGRRKGGDRYRREKEVSRQAREVEEESIAGMRYAR